MIAVATMMLECLVRWHQEWGVVVLIFTGCARLADRQGSRRGAHSGSPHIQTSRPKNRFDLTSSAISQAVAELSACSSRAEILW